MIMVSEPSSETISGRIHPELEEDLRNSGLMGTFFEVGSPRFIKFLLQPKLVMRSGWLLDPQVELAQTEVRAYVLRNSHDFEKEGILQQLIIDRNKRRARLVTQGSALKQTIEVDLQSFEVMSNSVTRR